MSRFRFRRRGSQRPGPHPQDAGSLPLALLLTMVGVILCTLLVPMVVTQLRTTRSEIQRAHALHAAQAGLDVALGHIRAASDASGAGILAQLPCGPLTGQVSTAGSARYQVTIDYLALNPLGHPSSWVAANRIGCTASGGPVSTPVYALLTAQGTDLTIGAFGTVPGRTLRATYPFQRSGQGPAGGQIRAYPAAAGPDLCLDAGSAAPTPGTTVQLRTCGTTIGGQTFLYAPNLTIVLVSSRTLTLPLGLCLDAGTPHADGTAVQLQFCATTTRPQQQWFGNDQANLEATADGTVRDGYCLNARTPGVSGSFVVLGSVATGQCRQGPSTARTFSVDATAGSGAAGATANQIMNLDQFIRCLDVTSADVNSAYLVLAPCQQSPDPVHVTWEQRWSYPVPATGATSATGLITTDPAAGRYCLHSPGAPGAGRYVTVQRCPGNGTPVPLTWTVFTDTGNSATSFQIRDRSGYCLAPTDPTASPPDLHPIGWRTSKVIVAVCDGSAAQKWNASTTAARSVALNDLNEV